MTDVYHRLVKSVMKGNSRVRILAMLFCTPVILVAAGGMPGDSLQPASVPWEYAALDLPGRVAAAHGVVKVAVIDDGFRLSHKALKDFIYTNENEVAGNYQDDDHNGFLDDVHGWDLADGDGDVSVPAGREDFFYHGTYVAGIITALFRQYFGPEAGNHLKIIPVKVVADKTKNKYYQEGYKGIRYAVSLGADIICCAWSGGMCSDEEKTIVAEAVARGVLVIGSAGNFFSEKEIAPAALPGVLSVAALDTRLRKTEKSNFGMRVDLSAPGDSINGPHPLADNAYLRESGTSPAAALVTGCVAILKSARPDASAGEIRDALVNTARPVDRLNLSWCGKLGAGIPDVARALDFLLDPKQKFRSADPVRPEGKIFYRKGISPQAWNIAPAGAFRGFHLLAPAEGGKQKMRVFSGDSLAFEGAIDRFRQWQFIRGNRFRIELIAGSGFPRQMEWQYYMETIDSTVLYCKGETETGGTEGILSDGSGSAGYANNSACKWLITVPAGKRVRITFDRIDTEPNVDYVWIFEGTATLPENLLAKFSGTTLPPVINTFGNQALVWFVTDPKTTGRGWELQYSAVD